MKKNTIEKLLNRTITGHTFVLVSEVIILVIVSFCAKRVLNSFDTTLGIVFLVIFYALFLSFVIYEIRNLVNCMKDRKSLENDEYVAIVGKIIEFKKNVLEGKQINTDPIVLNLETFERIKLHMDEDVAIVGETYKLIYLKNSKVAAIVKHLGTKNAIEQARAGLKQNQKEQTKSRKPINIDIHVEDKHIMWCYRYIVELLDELGAQYEEQTDKVEDIAFLNLPIDIIDDWFNVEEFVNVLHNNKLIDDDIKNRLLQIKDNFERCSESERTHEAMENSEFWAKQRLLAQQVLKLILESEGNNISQ